MIKAFIGSHQEIAAFKHKNLEAIKGHPAYFEGQTWYLWLNQSGLDITTSDVIVDSKSREACDTPSTRNFVHILKTIEYASSLSSSDTVILDLTQGSLSVKMLSLITDFLELSHIFCDIFMLTVEAGHLQILVTTRFTVCVLDNGVQKDVFDFIREYTREINLGNGKGIYDWEIATNIVPYYIRAFWFALG